MKNRCKIVLCFLPLVLSLFVNICNAEGNKKYKELMNNPYYKESLWLTKKRGVEGCHEILNKSVIQKSRVMKSHCPRKNDIGVENGHLFRYIITNKKNGDKLCCDFISKKIYKITPDECDKAENKSRSNLTISKNACLEQSDRVFFWDSENKPACCLLSGGKVQIYNISSIRAVSQGSRTTNAAQQ